MDLNQYKILWPINSLVVRDALEVLQSFTKNMEYFVKENVIELYKHVAIEEKQYFCLKVLNLKFLLRMSLFLSILTYLMRIPNGSFPC